MRNFAEELTYWYFRLNGFMLIDDFVLHRQDLESTQNADCDLLGIRLPNTYEFIGGYCHEDWDFNNLFGEGRLDSTQKIVMVCEVKSGETTKNEDIKLGNKDRLQYCVNRLGCWNFQEVSDKLDLITQQPITIFKSYQFAKILVTNDNFKREDFICLSLKQVEQFIVERMKKYVDPKYASKLFFPSALIQYIIWKIKNQQ